MSLPTEAGRYIAKPRTWGVGTSTNGAVEFAVEFDLLNVANPAGEWDDIGHLGYAITGYFYPFDKSGKANANTIKSIKESIGWSGASLGELNDGDWSGTEVQLVVDYEDYQGKPKIKVKWLNPRDYAGGNGVGKGDPAAVKALDARFASQLRAMGNTAPQQKLAGNGAAPTIDPAGAALGRAKRAYKALFPQSPNDELAEAFEQAFRKCFPARKMELLTAAEWDKFAADGFEKLKPQQPFGAEEQFKEDDIPF